MPNLYLPVAAMVISAILLVVYCAKRKVKVIENSLYLAMLIQILLDSMLVSLLFLNAYTNYNELFVKICNKLDFMCLFGWATCLFLYTFIAIHKNDENFRKQYFRALSITATISVVLVIIMWTLDIDIVMIDVLKSTAQGPAVNFTIISCVVYFLMSFAIIVFNPKKVNKKVIPVFVCLVITSIIAGLFTVNPYLICISMGLTIVNLTMYFTIENPDVQMLEVVNSAKDEAQKANQAKTDFLSSMSHEIRTPLNAIVGMSECILNDSSLEQAKADAKDIISASNNLLELVYGILDISKIEAGKMELVYKEYDLVEVATNLSKLIKSRIGVKPITLNTQYSSDIPGVLYGDEAKMRQIMTNLLTNAVKYTDKGQVDFKIACTNVDDTAMIEITVADTGHGIKKELIDTLFEKFKRLDEDKNSSIEGTGLGLSITKKLLDMMGGTIEVESTYGQGTVFTVNVPQTIRSMERTAEVQVEQTFVKYPGKKILVVDDNILNIKVESRMLEKYEVTADSASSGEECVSKCAKTVYDLILMDDMMPGMNGTETMLKLRELESFRTPIVVLTANAIEGMKDSYMENGFDDYLAKPIEKNELRRVLGRFI